MKLFGFTRLSTKLLGIFFLILGVTLIALFTVIETRAYFDERRNLVINLQELITIESVPIATALWELDDQKINSFLSEFGRLPFVQGTVVTDGSGKIVAKNGDIDTPAKSSEFVAQEPLIFRRGENSLTLGSIMIIAHDREILRKVKRKLVTDAIILFVLFAVLTGATFLATNIVVGRPLTLLQGSIEEIRRGGARKRVDWDANDELGQVVSAYNEMQLAQEKTEVELQASHDNLELRVKERTKELADARDRAEAAEKTLLESEKRLQSILEISPIGWAIRRRTDGTMLETNERLCDFIGMSRADVLKTTATELYSDPADRLSAVEDARKDGFVRDREIAFKKADGTTVWALQSLRSAQYKGEPAIFSWVYDITERKRAEEERLRQTQKMDVLGQMTSSVAHDFNNLLTVLRCNIDLLKSPNIGQELRQSLIKDCVEAVELSSKLTSRLTDFARKEPLAETTVDLNTLIVGFSDLLNRSVGKEVSIEYVLSDDTLRVLVDTVLVEVALLNLAINARDAIPEGGMITVSLSKTIIDGKVESIFGNVEEQPYALLQVSDTGVGMARETREHAFEAFFTTKDEGKGTGLGLNTVQDLVQSTGGFVQIESAPGQGTTVKIFLPLHVEEIS